MSSEGTIDGGSRMLWLWTNLLGHVVVAETADGGSVEGVFVAKDPGSMSIILANARRRVSAKMKNTALMQAEESLQIRSSDIVKLTCLDVQLADVSVKGINEGSSYQGHHTLQKWVGPEIELGAMSLDEENYQLGQFDQIAVNQNLFNVTSTYREEDYTTVLDKESLSPEMIAHAEKVCREIEGSGKNGGTTDSIFQNWADDVDEEMAHSAVVRDSEFGQLNKTSYVPPHLRNQMQPQ
eukprot:gene8286-12784_t